MTRLGIALDLGTSGFRGQAMALDRKGSILSTAITTRHPLPGANVMDHLQVAVDLGLDWAHKVVVEAVNQLIHCLGIKNAQVVRIAVCGNPIQLSLFQGIEIRDLAYAGKNKLKSLGVTPPNRDAQILRASEIDGLNLPPEAEVLIPPSIRHEIGADALAMMIQTGMLEKDEVVLATDYGTNAEIALMADGIVYTGSAAAGPALEGQQIEGGLLAIPGAICDVSLKRTMLESDGWTDAIAGRGESKMDWMLDTYVLDDYMIPFLGCTIDPLTGKMLNERKGDTKGITGTGVIALISEAVKAGIIVNSDLKTPDGSIHLPHGIKFTKKDLHEAGKAIGAFRAGHLALCEEAGIRLEDIETAYMSGAFGTYVDPLKAQKIGLVPSGVKKIYQVGNTSLAMAKDMIRDENWLWRMKQIADDLKQHHCMFATSKVFSKVYILELSHWTEGMPLNQYQEFLEKFGLPPLKKITNNPEIIKIVKRDIPNLGERGLNIIHDIGQRKTIAFEGCIGCEACIAECPEHALCIDDVGGDSLITVDIALCNGVACKRCEEECPERVFDLIKFFTEVPSSSGNVPILHENRLNNKHCRGGHLA